MGLDAPSSDITERIRATRRQMVLRGEIDPALPGEHAIHGRSPGAPVEVSDAVGRAADARARRAGPAPVVEMDYTDYTHTQPGSKELIEASDAEEPFDLDEPIQYDADSNVIPADSDPDLSLSAPDATPEDDEEVDVLAEPFDTEQDPRLDAILAGQDALASGLVAFAQVVADRFDRIETVLEVRTAPVFHITPPLSDDKAAEIEESLLAAYAVDAPPSSSWWKRLAAPFGAASGPYE